MLHKFFEEGHWFAAKKLGYGAGWPIAWQGWALLAVYIGLMLGCGLALEYGSIAIKICALLGMLIATLVVIWIAKKRTKGGWRWRP